MLTKMLHAFTAPTARTASTPSSSQRHPSDRGVEAHAPGADGTGVLPAPGALPKDRLPHAGGVNPTVVVLLEYERLIRDFGTAQLDTGQPISIGLARRFMCEAGIVPAVYRKVLGGGSTVLDLGRQARFHSEPQRLAMMVRDGGCTVEGCDRPSGWCQAHHDEVAWADGGGTGVDKGRLLCPFHHGKAHSPGYDMTRLPNGKVRFHRRT